MPAARGRLAAALTPVALAALYFCQRRWRTSSLGLGQGDTGASQTQIRVVPRHRHRHRHHAALTATAAVVGLATAALLRRKLWRRRKVLPRLCAVLQGPQPGGIVAADRHREPTLERRAASPVIFAAIFLSLLGFTMTGPILPALRNHFGLTASQAGMMTWVFPLGMFFAAFTFPVLSDSFGRKPILVASYLGVGTGLLSQAVAVQQGWSFPTFLWLRFCTGACAGGSTVVKAYLADASSPKRLPQVMAYREAAATLAFIVGPLLGGFGLAASSMSSVLLVESIALLSAGLLVMLFLREATTPPRRCGRDDAADQQQGEEGGAPMERMVREMGGTASPAAEAEPARWGSCGRWTPRTQAFLSRAYNLARLVGATVLLSLSYNLAQSFFDAFFPLHCAERFLRPAPVIGMTQTVMAVIVFAMTAFLYKRTVDCLGLVNTAASGLLLIGAGIAVVGIAGSWPWALFGVLLYAVGIPLLAPSIAVLLSQCAPAQQRGLVLGVDSAVVAVGRVASPALVGRAYEASPAVAFGLVGAVAIVAAAFAGRMGRRGLGSTSTLP